MPLLEQSTECISIRFVVSIIILKKRDLVEKNTRVRITEKQIMILIRFTTEIVTLNMNDVAFKNRTKRYIIRK